MLFDVRMTTLSIMLLIILCVLVGAVGMFIFGILLSKSDNGES